MYISFEADQCWMNDVCTAVPKPETISNSAYAPYLAIGRFLQSIASRVLGSFLNPPPAPLSHSHTPLLQAYQHYSSNNTPINVIWIYLHVRLPARQQIPNEALAASISQRGSVGVALDTCAIGMRGIERSEWLLIIELLALGTKSLSASVT